MLKTAPSLFAEKVRSSQRIPLSIPILIKGTDSDGKAFEEKTKTLVVNRRGAKIESQIAMSQNASIELTLILQKNRCPATVVWVGEKGPKGLQEYGIEVENPSDEFWGVKFPPDSTGPTKGDLQAETSKPADVKSMPQAVLRARPSKRDTQELQIPQKPDVANAAPKPALASSAAAASGRTSSGATTKSVTTPKEVPVSKEAPAPPPAAVAPPVPTARAPQPETDLTAELAAEFVQQKQAEFRASLEELMRNAREQAMRETEQNIREILSRNHADFKGSIESVFQSQSEKVFGDLISYKESATQIEASLAEVIEGRRAEARNLVKFSLEQIAEAGDAQETSLKEEAQKLHAQLNEGIARIDDSFEKASTNRLEEFHMRSQQHVTKLEGALHQDAQRLTDGLEKTAAEVRNVAKQSREQVQQADEALAEVVAKHRKEAETAAGRVVAKIEEAASTSLENFQAQAQIHSAQAEVNLAEALEKHQAEAGAFLQESSEALGQITANQKDELRKEGQSILAGVNAHEKRVSEALEAKSAQHLEDFERQIAEQKALAQAELAQAMEQRLAEAKELVAAYMAKMAEVGELQNQAVAARVAQEWLHLGQQFTRLGSEILKDAGPPNKT